MKFITRKLPYIIVLFLGFVLGSIWKNIPYLTLNKEVDIGDIANFIIALVAAFLVPYLLTKSLDNQRHIKNFLIDEVKDCIKALLEIKQKLDACHLTATTSADDIKEIMAMNKSFGLRVNSLIEQLEQSFKYDSKVMRDELYRSSTDYWVEITGGDLLNAGFQIDSSFISNHDKAFFKVQGYLKKCVHDINEF